MFLAKVKVILKLIPYKKLAKIWYVAFSCDTDLEYVLENFNFCLENLNLRNKL